MRQIVPCDRFFLTTYSKRSCLCTRMCPREKDAFASVQFVKQYLHMTLENLETQKGAFLYST